ncbi:hypothetical protein LR48_Vigan553s002000 [Vigna angularis]|uniref:Putative plant transposon protein domain-containing protein n=1 Tax=Phaseolus angularis TaxID=3914 RepID=A0A0L9TDW7_PHAAN|nr:hypothetical protein LR48_Vigan553s002000 [Vigna angularis]
MVALSSRLGKRSASSRREADPFGWFSDDDQPYDFICQWGYTEVIRHKCMSILYFRNEGFVFQEWLEKAGELQGDFYPNLVKVFYSNMQKKGNCLTSRVKGVEISIDYSIWKYVVEFQQGRLHAHKGIPGFYKTDIYNNFLKNPDMVGKNESFDIKNLRKDECLCACMITWILLPRGEDRSILNGEYVYLLYALQTGTQTDWSLVISDYMLKCAKQKEYHLPYGVFISRILRMQNVDITNENTIYCNENNVLERLFLDSVGLRKLKEEFMDERFKRLDEKMLMLQRSFTKLHQKMDYALRINAFGDTSVDDSDSGKNNADKKIMESSEIE